jgi:hypothetical protein
MWKYRRVLLGGIALFDKGAVTVLGGIYLFILEWYFLMS